MGVRERANMKRSAALLALCIGYAGCDAPIDSGMPQQPIGGGGAGGAGAASAAGIGGGGVGGGGIGGTGIVDPTAGVGGSIGGAGGIVDPTGGAGGTGVPPVPVRGTWGSFGGDLAHTRSSSSETMINAQNASGLKAAFDIPAPGVTATPALREGVVYWSDWEGFVHATDLVSQNELWKFDSSADNGGYTGSPAVTASHVYVANRNGRLSALHRDTGLEDWFVMLDAGVHTHIWSSPVVDEDEGILVVGVGGLGTRDNSVSLPSSQLETFRGWVQGVDIRLGELLWRFDTTPEPNGAGVSVWSSAALDTTRKLAFIGTGNNYYRPVSEYSDSLLAINYVTGKLAWHEQFTMNDAWTVATALSGGVDGDVGATPNLFTINGRDVVGVGDKPGRYHVRDRMTGDFMWTQELTDGSGYQGGVMAPAAYQDGVVYVISNNGTRSSTAFALDAVTGVPKWDAPITDPTYGGPAVGNGVLYAGDQAGNVWALDIASGAELWSSNVPQGRGGGFSLVDGMLFTGYGFHFSESRKEPLTGGLMAFSLTGTIPEPEMQMSDCMTDYALTTAPTFTNVYQGVLCPIGCTKVCHSTSAEAGLRLEGRDFAFQGLVGVTAKGPACSPGGHVLVVPNDPAASLLHGKLAVTPMCGVSMPPLVTLETTPVTPAMLEVVRAWIAAGAPNN
jgi:polyvinyl alcohol dehydrogenase (cytochrome)